MRSSVLSLSSLLLAASFTSAGAAPPRGAASGSASASAPASAPASVSAPARATATAAAPDLVVQLRPGTDPARLDAALPRGWRAAGSVSGRWWRLRAGDASQALGWREAVAALRRDTRFDHVLGPRRERLTAMPNDTLFASGRQWWLGAAASGAAGVPDLPVAWGLASGIPGGLEASAPVVAILDTGYTAHPELADRWISTGRDFVSSALYAGDGDGRDGDAADPGDRLTQAEKDADLAHWDGCETRAESSWHGTLMAGQIGALSNDGAGVAAVHWGLRSKLLPVRVAGRCGAAVADVVDGLRWAAGLPVEGQVNPHQAKLAVLGFAGFETCDPAQTSDPDLKAAAQLYIDTLQEVRGAGLLVIAAAGNLRGAVGRPASCPGVFAVTALNKQGVKATYANFGPQVALATVGGDDGSGGCSNLADGGLVSTANLGSAAPGAWGYAAASGTSFAAPVVAGVAALMWTANPALSVAQVEAGLRGSARPHVKAPLLGACSSAVGGNATQCECTTGSCGSGILDAPEALRFATNPLGYAAPLRSAVTLAGSEIERCAVALGLPVPTPAPTPTPSTGGGGGGAVDGRWLLALLAALVALRRTSTPLPESRA